jgi:hypothetical protein
VTKTKTRRHPFRTFVRGLLLVAFGLGLALAGFEILLRAVDPYGYADDQAVERFAGELRDPATSTRRGLSSFYLRPGARIEFLGQRFDINERGYRTPLVPHAKAPDCYRIVVVGDSVPFGWGIAEADCFPRRLETLLNARPTPFGKARVEVVNLSGPGRGLGDYLIVLEDEAMAYQPDLVLVPLIFNDVPLSEVDDAPHPSPPAPLPAWLRWSFAARFAHVTIARLSGAEMHGDYWIGIRSSPKALAAFPLAFELFRKAAHGVPILLFDTIGEGPGKGLPEIAAAAKAQGLAYLECFLDLTEYDTKWAIHAPKHNHPNPAAHAVYAQTLVDWFARNGW